MTSIKAGDQPALPRRHDPDLAELAAFILDATGRVVSWPVTATELFGSHLDAVLGHDVRDVLLTGPGHRELVDHALAQVAAGTVWTTTVAGGSLGDGRFALRWEPTTGQDGSVLVMVRRAWPPAVPGWLREAASRIGSSLDLSTTAAEAADVAVAGFADAAVVYASERLLAADDHLVLPAGHGTAVRRLAARLADYDDTVTATLLPAGEVLFLRAETPRAQAMATGQPVLSDTVDGELTMRADQHPRGPEVAARYTSFLTAPLIARGLTVGCMLFTRMPSSPPFSRNDIALASELASRAAVCIDNARMYNRERRTALALQRGLLPGRPSIPPGIGVAHHYLPFGEQVVGGDWHDIIPLPGDRAALIVGDAMGHGPEAAAVMVQLRTAAHTLAELDLPPSESLHRLDTMAARMDTMTDAMMATPFATCVYAVIDPADNSAEIARAGHPPPIVAHAGGLAEILDLPAGLPLGLGAGSFRSVRIELPEGSVLALYTDGLVESRSRPIDAGLTALTKTLVSALAQADGTLDTVCATVLESLRGHGEDDITLLLAQTTRGASA